MISYDEALQSVVESISPLAPREVSLDEASGLVLAKPAKALWQMPRWDNSAMDGFAIHGVPANIETGHTIVGASYAGHLFSGTVKHGEAVRITTGAVLPEGTDTVIPVEDTMEKDNQVFLKKSPELGQHVRYAGEEYSSEEVLVESGTVLKAGEIALLASAGVEQVCVYPRLRVAVISTGDELVELGQTPGPGQIINSNLHYLRTRLFECGCTPICLGIGADDQKTLKQLIEQALDADMIITSGGVSVGEKDHVQATLENLNFEKIFWKAAIKPGKPVLFGKIEGVPFFGLPGNPAATAATFELFAKTALKKLAGHVDVLPEKRLATLTDEVKGGGKRQSFLWCSLQWEKDEYQVTVSQRQGSGQIRCLTAKNAILAVQTNVRFLHQGDQVEVLLIE
jgi:molybdopterin molybdotransferase